MICGGRIFIIIIFLLSSLVLKHLANLYLINCSIITVIDVKTFARIRLSLREILPRLLENAQRKYAGMYMVCLYMLTPFSFLKVCSWWFLIVWWHYFSIIFLIFFRLLDWPAGVTLLLLKYILPQLYFRKWYRLVFPFSNMLSNVYYCGLLCSLKLLYS